MKGDLPTAFNSAVMVLTSLVPRPMPGKRNGRGTTADACARNSVKSPEIFSMHVVLRMQCQNQEYTENTSSGGWLKNTSSGGWLRSFTDGIQLHNTDSIQANMNSQVFLGTANMSQQWFPGRFSSPGNGLGTRLGAECKGKIH